MKNKSENGRSMAEMLAVLAIIGVLSVGGFNGYEYATASYRAGQIRDALLTAKKSAAINTSDSHTNEVKRMLGEYLSKYGLKVTTTASSQHHYKVELTSVPSQTCTHLWEMQNVLSSFSIKISTPTGKGGCQISNHKISTVPMAFEFNALDTQANAFGSSEPSTGCSSAADCGGGGYCQAGICVDCLTSSHCPDNQVCDEQTGRCTDDCSKGECQEGLHCINNRCGECEEPTEWNSSSKSCECPDGTTWKDNDCVPIQPKCDETCPVMCNAEGECECPGESKLSADGSKCECPAEKPHWTGTECTACPGGSNWNSGTGECECDGNKVWKESKQACVELVGECESNADCGPGEYCYMYYGYQCEDGEFAPNKFGFGGYSGYKSKCRNARKDIKDGKAGTKSGFVLGKPNVNSGSMTWWSAGRFCEALGRKQATLASIGCGEVSSGGTCDSQTRKNLYDDFGGGYVWMYDMYDSSCSAYFVYLSNGGVDGSYRNGYSYALCE